MRTNEKVENLMKEDQRLEIILEKHKNWLMSHDVDIGECKNRITASENNVTAL